MKKAITLAILTVALTLANSTVYASNGACSGHDGVQCSAGSDTDGSVICKDGWKGSSVQYTSIKDVCGIDYVEPTSTPVKNEGFSDLSDANPNRKAILYLKENGIINGYEDGTFKPNKKINRAEFLKILVEGSGTSPKVEEYSGCFNDVGNEWFAPYVCYAKAIGWVDGYPNGDFKPAQTVNKVEAIKMLLNSQGVEVPAHVTTNPFDDAPSSEWFAPFVQVAKDMGILEETGDKLGAGEDMKRASISENLYRTIEFLKSNPQYKYKDPNDLTKDEIIQNHCEKDWKDDNQMMQYCKDEQEEGLKALNEDKPDYVGTEQFTTIKAKCEKDWATDYKMQAYCREQQFQGVQDLSNAKPEYVTADDNKIIVEKCSNDWSKDYQMNAYCREQQYEAIEKLNAVGTDTSKRSSCASKWIDDFTMRLYCEEQ